jgi:hypothetical protein
MQDACELVPGTDLGAVDPATWQFLWSSTPQRLATLRRTLDESALSAAGFTVKIPEATGTAAEAAGWATQDDVRHLGPSWAYLGEWGRARQRANGDVHWVPTCRAFAKLVAGESVSLPPEVLAAAGGNPARVLLAVPSHGAMGAEGMMALRGPATEQAEIALLLGAEARPAELVERIAEAGSELIPLAGVIPAADGVVRMGPELYARAHRLPLSSWRTIAPELAAREIAWEEALAAAPEDVQRMPRYRGGVVRLGSAQLGIQATSVTAEAIAQDLRASLESAVRLTQPPLRATAAGQPFADGDRSMPIVNPSAPLEEWDPRGFAWFLRNTVLTLGLPVAEEATDRTRLQEAVEGYLADANRGYCVGAGPFFEQLGGLAGSRGADLVSGDSRSLGRAAFHRYLEVGLHRAALDTVFGREIVGDPQILSELDFGAGHRLTLPGPSRGWQILYHARSELEEGGRRADQDAAFSERATEDSAASARAPRFAIPVIFPTVGEALHAGLAPSYPESVPMGDERARDKFFADASVNQLFEWLTGYKAATWLGRVADAPDSAAGSGLPLRAGGLTRYAESLVARQDLAERMATDLPELWGPGRPLLVGLIRHKQALADCGWAGNSPAAELVDLALRREPVPTALTNALAKYVDTRTAPLSTRLANPVWKNQPTAPSSANPDDIVEQTRAGLRKLGKQHGSLNSLLAVDVGNPLVLGRVAFVHTSLPEVRAEVKSWALHHADLLPLMAADTATPLAVPGLERVVPELRAAVIRLDSNWAAALKILDCHPPQPPGLALERWRDAQSVLHTVQQQGVSTATAGAVASIAAVWGQTTETLELLPNSEKKAAGVLAPEYLPDFVLAGQRCRTGEEMAGFLQDQAGLAVAPEDWAMLEQAAQRRAERDKLADHLGAVIVALNAIEKAATFVRREIPALALVSPAVEGFDPDLVAWARGAVVALEAGAPAAPDSLGRARELVAGTRTATVAFGRAMGPTEPSGRLVGAAFRLSRLMAEATENLTSLASLTVPLVADYTPATGGKNPVLRLGGTGGAYLAFVHRLCPALSGQTTLQFDRTGRLQQQAIDRWTAQPAIRLDARGVANGADRAQLAKTGDVRNFPKGLAWPGGAAAPSPAFLASAERRQGVTSAAVRAVKPAASPSRVNAETPRPKPAMGATTLAIIGTAGRQTDQARLTGAMMEQMVAQAQAHIEKLRANGHAITTAVSGGAAYADHVAVRLFLKGTVPQLVLHLPAPFEGGRFRDTGLRDAAKNPGGTANYYHGLFREKTGTDSLAELGTAIAMGARVTVSSGFFARNALVAEADACVAMTFGAGPVCKDGGTANTLGSYLGRGKRLAAHLDLNTMSLHSEAQVPTRELPRPSASVPTRTVEPALAGSRAPEYEGNEPPV